MLLFTICNVENLIDLNATKSETNSNGVHASENEENKTEEVSTSSIKPTSDDILPAVTKSVSFGSASDTVESGNTIDVGSSAKKFSSTDALFSFGTNHEKPMVKDTKTTSMAELVSSAQTIRGDDCIQNESGKSLFLLSIFRSILNRYHRHLFTF